MSMYEYTHDCRSCLRATTDSLWVRVGAMSWRKLSFFTHSTSADPNDGLLEHSVARCTYGSSGCLLVADSNGVCHVLRKELTVRSTFTAHSSGVMHLLHASDALVLSFGLEQEGGVERAYMRAWKEGAGGAFECVRGVRVFSGGVPATSSGGSGAGGGTAYMDSDASSEPAITCCCASTDLTQIALGLSDGGVLLLRTSDLLKERFLRFKPLPSLANLPSHTPPAPITGVTFCYSEGAGRSPTELWVTTSQALLSVAGAGLRSEAACVLTDAGGANPRCACANELANQLVLGRDEAIYMYGPDERGPCFVFDGCKQQLLWHRSTLLVVSAPREDEVNAVTTPESAPGTGSPGANLWDVPAASQQVHTVHLYDLKNKCARPRLRRALHALPPRVAPPPR